MKNDYISNLKEYIGFEWSFVNKILINRHKYYDHKFFKESNGKKREIHAVKGPLKILQRRLYDKYLKYKFSPSKITHGFVENKDIVTNAKKHIHKKIVIVFDIKDFFPSIKYENIVEAFHEELYNLPKDRAKLIGKIACIPDDNSLPQGGVTSPYIANLVCKKLDYKLLEVAHKNNMDLTRYADDITFSTKGDVNIGEFKNTIFKIIEEYGFTPNKNKTRFMFPHNRQIVTGIVVNDGLNVNRKYIRNVRATLHNCEKTSIYKQLTKNDYEDNRSTRLSFRKHTNKTFIKKDGTVIGVNKSKKLFLQHLQGKINFIGRVVKANKYKQNEHYKKRVIIYKKLQRRLNKLVSIDRKYGDFENKYKERINNIKDDIWEPKTKNSLDKIINEKKKIDPRYLKVEFNKENVSFYNEQVADLEIRQIKNKIVLEYLKQLKNNFIGYSFPSRRKIMRKRYYELVKKFHKDRIHLPIRFAKFKSKIFANINSFIDKKNEFDNWERKYLNKNVIKPLENLILLPENLDSLLEQIKSKNEYINIKIIKDDELNGLCSFRPCILEGITNIINSIAKNSKHSVININLRKNLKTKRLIIKIGPSYQVKKLSPSRAIFLDQEITNALVNLYGFCDYYVVANFKKHGWKKINMMNSKHIENTKPLENNYHVLKFRI